jgi:hypothetical protein
MKTTSFLFSGASVLLVFLLAAAGSVGRRPQPGEALPGPERGRGPGVAAESAVWDQTWDGKVDDVLDRNSKAARVELSFGGGKVSGEFSGKVLGSEREAEFDGRVIEKGGTTLVLMQQVEKDYICAYQLQATDAGYFGVWHDTRGGKGDVEFRKPAEGVIAR